MEYQTIQMFSGIVGLLAFVGVFMTIVLWTYRPGAAKEMEEHSQIPWKED